MRGKEKERRIYVDGLESHLRFPTWRGLILREAVTKGFYAEFSTITRPQIPLSRSIRTASTPNSDAETHKVDHLARAGSRLIPAETHRNHPAQTVFIRRPRIEPRGHALSAITAWALERIEMPRY
jgi:hypothetical protein